ncbi:MAG: hypothetical protein WA979_08900 [Pacificimonas sp.]
MSIEGIGNVAATQAAFSAQEGGLAALRSEAGAFVGGQIDNLSLSPDRRVAFQEAWVADTKTGNDAFSDRISEQFAPGNIGEQSDLMQSAAHFAEQVATHLHVNQLSAPADALGPVAASLDHASAVQPSVENAAEAATWLSASADYLGNS